MGYRVVRNVPKSQVYAGSRGGHSGRLHLVPGDGSSYDLLCGRKVWLVGPPDAPDRPTPRCPECARRAKRRGIEWPDDETRGE